MICIYHSKDLDGFASGAIVKKKYPDATLIGYDYNDSIPDISPIVDDLIIVDVSFPIPTMRFYAEVFNKMGKTFTWIDHHISAISEFRQIHGEMGSYVNAVLEDGIAACEITWKYLFPGEEMPVAVRLLGEYDTWRNKDAVRWEMLVLPFQYGMRTICSSPETMPDIFLEPRKYYPVADVIKDGTTILTYQKMQNERACKGAFETVFQELRAICLNVGGGNSQMFESVYDESRHDVMIPFFYSGHGWTFSLFTTREDVDCSQLAKMLGGGGHRKAAGFKLKELPEEFKLADRE